MAGPGLPSGGSDGTSSPPPLGSMKRERGDDADAGPSWSLPRRATRSSASAPQTPRQRRRSTLAMAGPGLPSGGSDGTSSPPPLGSMKRERGDDADAGPSWSLPRRATRSSASVPQTPRRRRRSTPAMAGPGLPSGGSDGTSSPPPLGSMKRERGDDADAGPSWSLPRRATRSSASARRAADEAVDGAVRLARRAAAGALWATTTTTTRGRECDHADVERIPEVIREVRQTRSAGLDPKKIQMSGTRSSGRVASQISYLSSHPKKRVGTDPVMHLASVPEWKNAPSEEDTARVGTDPVMHLASVPEWKNAPSEEDTARVGTDPVMHLASVPEWKNAPSEEDTAKYKAETLQKLGTIICPLNMDISATDKPEKTRKRRVDKCSCSHPGSEDCVRVHVRKARSWIKDQLGEEAFRNCGLDAMGEQGRELWTAKHKKKLGDIDKLIPQKKHKKFMQIASKQLSQEKTKDLALYYYNVFLPSRLASLTRAEPKQDGDVDTNDDDSNQDDDNNGRHSEERRRSACSRKKRSAGHSSMRKYVLS